MASEIVKCQAGLGRAKELYFFRDQQGLEVDFVVPTGAARFAALEAKASRSVAPHMADSLLRLKSAATKYALLPYVIYRPGPGAPRLSALRPGVKAVSVSEFLDAHFS